MNPTEIQILEARATLKRATVAVQRMVDDRRLTKWILPIVHTETPEVTVVLYAFGELAKAGWPSGEQRMRSYAYDKKTLKGALDDAARILKEMGALE